MKYKDDARDVVSAFDFLTIHVTFSVMNAWLTYMMFFVTFTTMTSLCPFKAVKPPVFCGSLDKLTEDEYYYVMFNLPSKFAFLWLLMEMSMFLAYYKDVIFSFTTLLLYSGMYKNS